MPFPDRIRLPANPGVLSGHRRICRSCDYVNHSISADRNVQHLGADFCREPVALLLHCDRWQRRQIAAQLGRCRQHPRHRDKDDPRDEPWPWIWLRPHTGHFHFVISFEIHDCLVLVLDRVCACLVSRSFVPSQRSPELQSALAVSSLVPSLKDWALARRRRSISLSCAICCQ